MDYAETYPNIVIRYYASDVVLLLDSDAACLVILKAKSRITGCFYLSDHPSKTNAPVLNAPMLVMCETMCHFVSSAIESITAVVLTNYQLALPIRHALESVLENPQLPTPLKSDNSTTKGFMHNSMHKKI